MKTYFAFILCALALAAPALAAVEQPQAIAAPRQLFQLSYDDAESAIAEALVEKQAGEKITVVIKGRSREPLFSFDKPVEAEIRGLRFEPRSRSWNASLMVVSGGEVASAMPLSGRYEEMAEVPVLRRQVRGGHVIGENDVEMRPFPAARLRDDTIADMAALVGKTPEHLLSPNRPVRRHEIVRPALVKKNAVVQMVYRTPGMEITATGMAVGEGAEGEVIAVRNLNSKKIIRAVITGENTVSAVGGATALSTVGQSSGGSYAAN